MRGFAASSMLASVIRTFRGAAAGALALAVALSACGGGGGGAATTGGATGGGGTTATAGVKWRWANPLPQGNSLNAVAWSASLSKFVTVGDAGTILTSPDGVTWTQQTSGTTNTLYGVAWSGALNRFVAVGAGGTILVSP